MVFSSPAFLFLYFPLFFGLYFLLPRGLRNGFILLASVAFYALGAGALTLVALLLLAFNWLLAAALARRRWRSLLLLGVAVNLAPLLLYKYLPFLAQVLGDLGGAELGPRVAALGLVLPLGISFYTFHFLSYLLDVQAGRIAPETSLPKFAIYIFLFPHLIAGPVVRFAEVKRQLDSGQRRTVGRAVFWGMVIFVIGLAKKLLIADPLGAVVDQVHRPDALLTTYSAWLGALCYSFQIYFDFSGYTDMAIGMARMMGFRFPRNFERPYAAASVTAFWQRWHMTLSRWFRDYVYIPLGGNRGAPWQVYRNLFVVFGLCALWHGAAYTFLLWGLGHGLLLALERSGWLKTARWGLGGLPVFTLVTLLWVPFRASGLEQTWRLWGAMSGLDPRAPLWLDENRMLADPRVIVLLLLATAICLCGEALFGRLRRAALRRPRLLGAYCLLLYPLACLALVERGFHPFIYFQF